MERLASILHDPHSLGEFCVIVHRTQNLWLVLLVFFLSVGLAGCSNEVPEPTVTPSPGTLLSPEPTFTRTPEPTQTPPLPLVILVSPVGADEARTAEIERVASDLSQQDGFRFQVQPELTPEEIEEANVKIVLALPPDPGIEELSAAAPSTQFLSIAIPQVEPKDNLSVIDAGTESIAQQAFMAGFIAAAVSEDWRVAVVTLENQPDGGVIQESFSTGVKFFCGLCRPTYPPYYQYPLFVEVPAGAGQSEWQAAVDYLSEHAVKTVYVSPQAAEQDLWVSLDEAGINMIGLQRNDPSLKDHWVASLQPDLESALRTAWSDILEGKNGKIVAPLVIRDQNPDIFSPGKQLFSEETLQDLLAGYIGTGGQSPPDE
jgi:hypothetical protein